MEQNDTLRNQISAVNILIAAARAAQKRGLFSLEEAEIISQAIRVLTTEKNREESA